MLRSARGCDRPAWVSEDSLWGSGSLQGIFSALSTGPLPASVPGKVNTQPPDGQGAARTPGLGHPACMTEAWPRRLYLPDFLLYLVMTT